MKKVIIKLSKEYHTNQKVDNDQIRSIFNNITTDPSPDIRECLNMIVNMVSDIDFMTEIFELAILNDWITEQIYTAMVKLLCTNNQPYRAIEYIKQMGSNNNSISINNIQPHVRTFIPLCSLRLNSDQYAMVLTLIKKHKITPTTELFSLLIVNVPSDIDHNLYKTLIEWAGQHCTWLDINTNNVNTNIIDGTCRLCNTKLKTININD